MVMMTGTCRLLGCTATAMGQCDRCKQVFCASHAQLRGGANAPYYICERCLKKEAPYRGVIFAIGTILAASAFATAGLLFLGPIGAFAGTLLGLLIAARTFKNA